jgi:phage terminase small subunit|tara:strand:+ start:92 stop:568 length:477 start_codon:yes stop_codon:yes gene_type:complete
MTKKKLTPKQQKFAQNVAKGMSKKDAAIAAGYSEKNATKAGYVLSSDENPLVKKKIEALQTSAAKKVSLDLSTHLTDLKDIREGAMRNGAWSAAVGAEVARGKAAGLYINRSELVVNKVETMSKDQILERMQQIYHDTGGVLPMGTIIEGDDFDEDEI